MGASPQRLAWSIAVGILIGLNPLLGSTTVAALALAFLFRLNVPASQLGTHCAYPLQLLLFLPLIHAGSVLFGTAELSLTRAELLTLAHEHPWQFVRVLWIWEWHALVVWATIALVLTPVLAMLLAKVLARAIPRTRHTVSPDYS